MFKTTCKSVMHKSCEFCVPFVETLLRVCNSIYKKKRWHTYFLSKYKRDICDFKWKKNAFASVVLAFFMEGDRWNYYKFRFKVKSNGENSTKNWNKSDKIKYE